MPGHLPWGVGCYSRGSSWTSTPAPYRPFRFLVTVDMTNGDWLTSGNDRSGMAGTDTVRTGTA
ncbi:hypothetical protein SAMN05421806_13316 [Streptomyces indicus]|uniref:Uncharacterized protein n=1 Tax=Streptomyces indicus TaxID=417292 RepID=A0A1G9JP52_9ACTN|nr:hypothetical protein SAMN05421806_13316 [Streptomyces indicus]